MPDSPRVSVLVQIPATAEEIEALVTMLAGQTLQEWELVAISAEKPKTTDTRVRVLGIEPPHSPKEVRQVLLENASGNYVLFLCPGDTIATPRQLELHVLWAEAEQAKICVGRVRNETWTMWPKTPQEGWCAAEVCPEALPLCGVLFQRTWVRACGLRFHSVCTRADMAFWCEALALAGRCFMRRDVFIAMPLKGDYIDLPKHELTMDCLIGMAELARFSRAHAVAWLHARQYESLFGERFRSIMDYLAAAFPEERQAAKESIEALEAAFDAALAPAFIGRSPVVTFLVPLVSVIVPVYNTAPYLRRCLLSLKAQTLPNIEIVCVNDGSTDDSLAILEAMRGEMPNLVVLSQKNAGQGAARNAAMRIAKGRYIGFVDSDDWVEPEMFERMAEGLEAYPEAEVAECGTLCEWTYEIDGQEKAGVQDYFHKTLPPGLHAIAPQALTTGGPCDKLFRTSFLFENNILFPEGVKNEDEAFCFFTLCRASWFVLFHDQWYHYIRNASGTMAQQAADATALKMPDTFSIFNLLVDFAEAEDKIPFIGRLLKGIIGAVSRFSATPLRNQVEEAGAWLLHKAKYELRADFILSNKKAWCTTYAINFINCLPEKAPLFTPLQQWWPKSHTHTPPALSPLPLVTFIIPVYNVEAYLSRCLESLRAQVTKYAFEILCLDDGSNDTSASILDDYQNRDPRIRVIHKSNTGVADTRNLGIQKAKGNYIVFVDGDDWVAPSLLEETLPIMEQHRLEVLAFDYECFDWRTEAPLAHWWMLKNHLKDLPTQKVITLDDFSPFYVYGSSCTYVFNRDFLLTNQIVFPRIGLSEDLCFLMRVFTHLRRGWIVPKTYYHYRRGNPSSAVARLSRPLTNTESQQSVTDEKGAAIRAYIEFLQSEEFLVCTLHGQSLLLGRLLSEMRYFLNLDATLAPLIRNAMGTLAETIGVSTLSREPAKSIWDELNRRVQPIQARMPARITPQLPFNIRNLLDALRQKRAKSSHDLWLVTAFMGPGSEADPRDSWTFFSWLQAHQIPSVYLICKRNKFYKKLKTEGHLKNVIALNGTGYGDFEILKKCFDALTRAKIIVQEDCPFNPLVLKCLKPIRDISWAFLQHGVIYVGKKVIPHLLEFDFINVSGEKEAEYISENLTSIQTPPTLIRAGLPRWDLIKDESRQENCKVVFVMFTWRTDFANGLSFLERSLYYRRIKALFSEERINYFNAHNIRFVFAPHHRLLTLVKNTHFDFNVEICAPSDVAYWIRHASCCLTDYSSVSFDFFFQMKPIIYWMLDWEDTTLSATTRDEIRLAKTRMSSLCNVVHSIEEVADLLSHYAENGFVLEPEKRAIAESFFTYKKDICRHLYENLEAALQSQKVQVPMGETQEGGEA